MTKEKVMYVDIWEGEFVKAIPNGKVIELIYEVGSIKVNVKVTLPEGAIYRNCLPQYEGRVGIVYS